MSLAACPHCWEDQCVCGFKFFSMTDTDIQKQIRLLHLVQEVNAQHPNTPQEQKYQIMLRLQKERQSLVDDIQRMAKK